ncbi:cytochrome P450 [Allokutzneria sp. A3M-2-11 16]|uniref:cytochrome P450 n=1 Tax=Allokutzneria sp. A3M-2-11 16 TaxID=2962043 RepID=UPI0020B6E12F|nr:cytochrome P450 [Allokutzneria sp. A3M-2-11 16]MCP3805148.1 cytochrome P450 [Allokutzneria sp. A3M-2-11 16]
MLKPMIYPDGHSGWETRDYATARAVLADPRFSARPELMHLAPDGSELPPAEPGAFLDMDAPEHTRYRRLLTGKFTVRRMRVLSEMVERIAAEHLDAMEENGPPVDLVEAYAQPVPAQMICEMLGVSYEERDHFQQHAMVVTGSGDGDAVVTSFAALQDFLRGLVKAKRAKPTDDLLSDLATTELTDEELTNIGVVLLGAGLDTTANMLALGTLTLLGQPDGLAAMRAEPEPAVEELLRHLTVIPFLVRAALEDVELDGQLIRAGDAVTLQLGAANRDPRWFDEPDRVDLGRKGKGHLAFGHGVHQCLGQQLARVQLRVGLPALASRFPGLRLVEQEVAMRDDAFIRGVHELRVAW